MRRDTARVMTGGGPAFWLGANFWSRTGGPLMWRSYDSDLIRAELAVLKDHGLTMTRSFFYWPDFMPSPYEIDEKLTAQFADFLDRHVEQGLATIPTFIVGHMSGENWDPGWRNGRHLYEDVWMVGRQAWFAAEMTRRYADHPAVAGWLVSNEMPIYGGSDHRSRDRRGLGADHQGRGPRGRRPAAVLARRRRLGDRGHRGRQRLPPGRHIRHIRFPRPAHLPRRRRPHPPALRGRPRLRAGGHVRQAGDHGGVRRQLGLRLRRERRHVLPARAARHPAGRGDRLDRVEQHGLRAAGQRPVPPPRLRAELRAHRRPRHAEADARGDAGLRAHARGHRPHPHRASRHRHRPHRLVLPGHPVPVHLTATPIRRSPGRSSRDTSRPGWPTCRPSSPGRRRASRTARGCTSPRRSSSSSPPPPPASRSSRAETAPPSTSPTARATSPGTAGPPTGA